MAFVARTQRLVNSAHDVATMAIRKGALESNFDEASYRARESRTPFGSSSNVVPENVSAANSAVSPGIESEESNTMPPSIALSWSCVMVGFADASKMDGDAGGVEVASIAA